ncbi:hypothetical protein HMPREF9413_4299 [Paenibacillus sp. HGF7]|nr:hypothetical protein HMPREF9413_4299 [Paenibacillus sp. HGF7]
MQMFSHSRMTSCCVGLKCSMSYYAPCLLFREVSTLKFDRCFCAP